MKGIDISLLLNIQFANNFSHSVVVFIYLVASFLATNVFILFKHSFPTLDMLLVAYLRISCLME
jgi:hypothetical protein